MTAQKQSAEQFRALHAKGQLLVLPNAWDAASARLAEDCGAAAIATSSAAVAWSHGYADGETIPVEVLFTTVKEIIRIVRIPVSVDSEMGYSRDPAAVAHYVGQLIDLGAVGMNIEDGTSPPDLLAKKIAAIREEVSRRNADFFVNARTDVYLKKLTAPDAALDEALSRGKIYRDAGADGFFVPGLDALDGLKVVADTIELPLNALPLGTSMPAAAELKRSGVRRISAGAGPARAAYGAMRRAAKHIVDEGRFDTMFAETEGLPNLNALMTR